MRVTNGDLGHLRVGATTRTCLLETGRVPPPCRHRLGTRGRCGGIRLPRPSAVRRRPSGWRLSYDGVELRERSCMKCGGMAPAVAAGDSSRGARATVTRSPGSRCRTSADDRPCFRLSTREEGDFLAELRRCHQRDDRRARRGLCGSTGGEGHPCHLRLKPVQCCHRAAMTLRSEVAGSPLACRSKCRVFVTAPASTGVSRTSDFPWRLPTYGASIGGIPWHHRQDQADNCLGVMEEGRQSDADTSVRRVEAQRAQLLGAVIPGPLQP